jgi:transcriptional regulator with XRE-family HTH domain
LKTLRVSRKWDQHRLAEAARAFPSGITQSQISRYENGQEPSGRNALALAKALGVSVESLYVAGETEDDEEDSEVPLRMTLSLDDMLRLRIDEIVAESLARSGAEA